MKPKPARRAKGCSPKLPKNICVLDIETEKTSFKNPENSQLAVVGTLIYTLRSRRYYPHPYKYFVFHQLPELEGFLKTFDGLIIGFNIFDFDYRVLSSHISLQGIIEKTVDLLPILRKRNGNILGGLSLNDLALVNFRKGKTLNGKVVSQLWREGKQRQVIRYNQNDCILTKRLWQKMVKNGSVLVNSYGPVERYYALYCYWCHRCYVIKAIARGQCFIRSDWYRPHFHFNEITLSNQELKYLAGQRPFMTYRAFQRKMNTNARSKLPRQSPILVPCIRCGRSLAELPNDRLERVLQYKVVGEVKEGAVYHVLSRDVKIMY